MISMVHGVHAPNCLFRDMRVDPEGPALPGAAELAIGQGGFHRIKLLWPDHGPETARALRRFNLDVLVRVPGEGLVNPDHVRDVIAAFGLEDPSKPYGPKNKPLASVIEVGNEPTPNDQWNDWEQYLWHHAAQLETCWKANALNAAAQGIALCTPGWRGQALPPSEDTLMPGWQGGPAPYKVSAMLAMRLGDVYRKFDRIGAHAYDAFTLDRPEQWDRLLRWHTWGWRNVEITEYGIAAFTLLPYTRDPVLNSLEKADRLAAFVQGVSTRLWITGAYLFILGGGYKSEFSRFGWDGRYNPAGENSYWLQPEAWARLRARLDGEAVL